MKIKKVFLFLCGLIITLSFFNQLYAQKKFTLNECIDYALENSYSVKQKILEREGNLIQLQARRTSIAPSLGINMGQNFDFGRSLGADNIYVNKTQATSSMSVGLNMDIFQGLRTHHQIKSDKLNLEATLFDIEDAKENIELMITANYLQILLNKEMLEVYKAQVVLDQEQVDRINVLVNNGKSSDAELYVAKSNLASGQVSVVEAENAVRLALLDLAQLMNYPDVENFDIEQNTDNAGIENMLSNRIDLYSVVDHALDNRPVIKAALARIDKAKRDIKVYQSGWYPTLRLFANYGTGYYYQFNLPNLTFADQFKELSGESVGLSLYIPIFDKLSTHYSVKQQRLFAKSQELQLEEVTRNLRKSIEQAYVNAVAAQEKYTASQAAYEASQIAFEYEGIKYNAGASTNYEYNEAKNKYLTAQSNLIQAKFDFLFRMKILEFYGR